MAECPYAPASPSGSPPSGSAALPPEDPLVALNDVFHDAYSERREALVSRMGPVIVQIDDVLILRHGELRLEGASRTRRYHEFKAIDHLPLGLFVLLLDAKGSLDARSRARLGALRGLITVVADGLPERGFTPEQLARQRRILEASKALVERVLADGQVPADALTAFARAQAPELLANAEDAARDQLETMHATVEAWKERLAPEDRERLRVVVAAAHMSTPGNLSLQYFSLALGEAWAGRFDQEDLGPGKRVLVSETGFDEAQALTLLATQTLDARVGRRFFGEEDRLTRDVLADASERILSEMFQTRPEPTSAEVKAQ